MIIDYYFYVWIFSLKTEQRVLLSESRFKKTIQYNNYCIRVILNETCDNKIYTLDQIGYTLYLLVAKQI